MSLPLEPIVPQFHVFSDSKYSDTESEAGSEAGSEDGSEAGSEAPKGVDYNSDEIHDEVLDLLAANNAEIIELISTDPEYYLGIVQNYTRMKDGREIYLPDLFNILVNREGGRLKIKFKMSDNTQWYEVGFNGGDFDDKAVYKAFTEKVNTILKSPQLSRHEFLADTMKPEVKRPAPMINQGNQNRVTKIDRFLGRTPQMEPQPPAPAQPRADPVQTLAQARQVNESSTSQVQPQARQVNESTSQVKISNDNEDSLLNSVVQSFKEQLRARLHHEKKQTGSLPLVANCPSNKKTEYAQLLATLNSDNQFVRDLVESLSNMTPGQRLLTCNFISGLQSFKSEEELANQLGLSQLDRQLLSTYKIKLSEL